MNFLRVSGFGLVAILAAGGCAKKKPMPVRGIPFADVQMSTLLKLRLETQYGLDPAKLCLQGVTLNDGKKTQVIEASASPSGECPKDQVAQSPFATLKIWGEYVVPKKPTDVPAYLVIGQSDVAVQNTPVATIRGTETIRTLKSEPTVQISAIEVTDFCSDVQNTSKDYFDLQNHCAFVVDPATKEPKELAFQARETLDRALLNVHLMQKVKANNLEAHHELLMARLRAAEAEVVMLAVGTRATNRSISKQKELLVENQNTIAEIQAKISAAKSPDQETKLRELKALAEEISTKREALLADTAQKALRDWGDEVNLISGHIDYVKSPFNVLRLAGIRYSVTTMRKELDVLLHPHNVSQRQQMLVQINTMYDRSNTLLLDATQKHLDRVDGQLNVMFPKLEDFRNEGTRQFLSDRWNETDQINQVILLCQTGDTQKLLAAEGIRTKEIQDRIKGFFTVAAKEQRTELENQLKDIDKAHAGVTSVEKKNEREAIETKIAKINQELFDFKLMLAQAAARKLAPPPGAELPEGLLVFGGGETSSIAELEKSIEDVRLAFQDLKAQASGIDKTILLSKTELDKVEVKRLTAIIESVTRGEGDPLDGASAEARRTEILKEIAANEAKAAGAKP